MPKLPENAVPSYRLHKQSGQAIVTLSGRDFLLGPFNSAASRREYARVVGEWIADGRRLHHRAELGRTVNELILSYWRYAKSYYCKNGTPTSEIGALEHALVPLKELYGNTLAAEFRPLALQALRERMIGRGWARKTINGHIQRVKRMFKWAVARELVPPDVHHGLSAVEGLRRGRSAAKETEPVRPVPEGQVDAVIAALSPSLAKVIALQSQRDEASTTVATNPAAEVRLRQLDAEIDRLAARVPDESPVAAMVQLQRLTGMRSGELVVMRSADVDVSGDNWVYMPPSHKTEHHDRPRSIYLGPRARQVLRPFLRQDLQAYLFDPRRAVAAHRARERLLRKSKVQPSQQDRRKRSPRRTARDHYDTASYRRALQYGCERAGVPEFHPHRLRHNCATRLRALFGIEAARVVLGHTSATVTELYAELDRNAANDAMARAG